MPSLIYASIPRASGMFTFYRNLRAGLKDYGWDIRCLTIGLEEHKAYDKAFADDGCISLVPEEADLEAQRKALIKWCASEGDMVLIPMNSTACLTALCRLPSEVRVLMRCAFTSKYGYRLVLRDLDRVSRIVALTPRHVTDLTKKYCVSPDKVTLIEHGPDLSRFASSAGITLRNQARLEIAFLGQLEHITKGVFYLPAIIRRLEESGINYHLRIAGGGPDAQALIKYTQEFVERGNVSFSGIVPFKDVPQFLAKTDIFLFTSHEEGFSNSLMEAMAAGCVPVASRIPGITDFIVQQGETGYLCTIGASNDFAEAIIALSHDRDRLRRMGAAAREEVHSQFNAAAMVQKYATLLDQVSQAEMQPAL